jgi:hypothetical protein
MANRWLLAKQQMPSAAGTTSNPGMLLQQVQDTVLSLPLPAAFLISAHQLAVMQAASCASLVV